MRSKTLPVVTMLAAALAVSSCASRVETSLQFPPADDLKVDDEPAYPVAALDACPTNLRSDPCPAEQAERQWWNAMVDWGRSHRDKVARICGWARDLKMPLPDGYCGRAL